MNFGSRAISMFNRATPKISKVIGQVANAGRNIGQIVKSGRNIGTIANQLSGNKLAQLPIAQKIQEVANKIESGANYVSGNEGNAQQALSTLSRKVNA